MPISTVRQVQALIRGRRTELKLSQEHRAGLAGVSRKWLSEFERGATTAVELPLVLRVLAALGLTVEISPAESAGRDRTSGDQVHGELDLDDVLRAYASRGTE